MVDTVTFTIIKKDTTLEYLKSAKTDEINAACETEIVGGFSCGDYRYDSAPGDQLNLHLAVIGAISGTQTAIPYRCYLPDGIKDMVIHTPEQMIAVGQVFGDRLTTCIAKANNLKKSITAATTKEELDAITW